MAKRANALQDMVKGVYVADFDFLPYDEVKRSYTFIRHGQ
jgi:hypothetical protein